MSSDDTPLATDRFFDPWRTPRSTAAQTLVRNITTTVENYEKRYHLRRRQRRADDQRTMEATVAAVLCDAMHSALMSDERGIAIPRSNRVLSNGDRYSAPALNRQLHYVLDLLSSAELGWLAQEAGFLNPFGRNQRTLIRPTARFIDTMRRYGVTLDGIGRDKAEEAIVLKSQREGFWDDGKYLDYTDTPTTIRYREEVRTINDWLASADLTFDEAALEWDRPIDTANRTLRRYFSRASFESGGRLFGGFWQGLSKAERLNGITINGRNVVGLDYGQIAPRILYGLAKTQPPDGDLYEIPGLTTLNGVSYRDGVKKMMNALTFSDPKRKPVGTKDLLPSNLSAKEVIELIRKAHSPIADLLGSDIGHRVQFYESEVMVKVLLKLSEELIVALPIHDGLVVSCDAEDKAKAAMQDTLSYEVGVDCPVSVEKRSHINYHLPIMFQPSSGSHGQYLSV